MKFQNRLNIRESTIRLYGWYPVTDRDSIESDELLKWQLYTLKLDNNWKTNEFKMYSSNDDKACKIYHQQFILNSGYKIINLSNNTILESK